MNPYIDPKTGAHFNKLGITDRAELREVEYAVTDLRIAQLRLHAPKGQFDLDHLRTVHRHIFQDLYEWAGKDRTVNFSKRDAADPDWAGHFAPAKRIDVIAASINEDLKSKNFLRGLDQKDFATGITALYAQVNWLHPFVEGNGRSTQTFISQLANEAGYELNFAKVDKDEWNHAAARSMPQRNRADPTLTRKPDTRLIEAAFHKIVEPIRERQLPITQIER